MDDIVCVTAYLGNNSFPEIYPNRIPEDVYDSLEGNPSFVYVMFGPSILNV